MSAYATAAYSYASILYKENTQKGIGRIQAAIGIGPIVCLVSSSFIFKWFGFFVTFAVIATGLLIVSICIILFVPELKNPEEEVQEEGKRRSLKSGYIFTDFRIIGTFMNTCLAMALIDAPSSLVADRFEEFDLPEYLKGLTFLFSNIPFTITSLLLHRLAKNNNIRRIIL